ncbi:MAG TPA: MFS transporter, partial [Candidatus Acidoferrum sp.]|nr:MFS transporter [Candidatus Acidoferrum sp.]
ERTKLLVALFAAQVCGATAHSLSMAVGGIMAATITGTNTTSGLPVGVAALGAALASWPLARWMAVAGRRPGLALGYALGGVGTVLSMVGVTVHNFPLFLLGMTLFGLGSTSNLLARYAAADVSPGARRGRAMGFIIWGSAGGAIIGPNLLAPALAVGNALGIDGAASAFLISVAGYGVAALVIELFLRPDPLALARQLQEDDAAGHAVAAPRSLGAILGDVRVQVALATLTVGQFVMISTTSTSPVYLHDQGHSVKVIGIAASLHLGGMYVTSPLSGWLADRVGRLPTIGAGALLLIGSTVLAGFVPGSDSALVILGLFLNGVGWNLSFVAGSALLTDALSPRERASTQGLADLVMSSMGALGSTAGGIILGLWGFTILNVFGAALVLAPLAVTVLRRPQPVSSPTTR